MKIQILRLNLQLRDENSGLIRMAAQVVEVLPLKGQRAGSCRRIHVIFMPGAFNASLVPLCLKHYPQLVRPRQEQAESNDSDFQRPRQ